MMHCSGAVDVVTVDVVDVVIVVDVVEVVDVDADVECDVVTVDVVDVVAVLQKAVPGLKTEIVAVPACAASNSAWRVPSASYVLPTRGRMVLSDVVGSGSGFGPPPSYPVGAFAMNGGSVRSMASPTTTCTGLVGRFWSRWTVDAAAAVVATTRHPRIAPEVPMASRTPLRPTLAPTGRKSSEALDSAQRGNPRRPRV